VNHFLVSPTDIEKITVKRSRIPLFLQKFVQWFRRITGREIHYTGIDFGGDNANESYFVKASLDKRTGVLTIIDCGRINNLTL